MPIVGSLEREVGSGTSMQSTKQISWLLAGYLVLLLNLGPSVHRAQCLGLHHQAGEVAEHASCCSCSSPYLSKAGNHSPEASRWSSSHECDWCKFFDQLHVLNEGISVDLRSNEVPFVAFSKLGPEESPAVASQARGPPVVA